MPLLELAADLLMDPELLKLDLDPELGPELSRSKTLPCDTAFRLEFESAAFEVEDSL